jgi:type IV pilus assembly protein PilY1
MKKPSSLPIVLAALALALGLFGPGTPRPAFAQASCPQTSPPTAYSSTALDTATNPDLNGGIGGKDGVVYDSTGVVGLLRLKKQGGYFKSTALGISDPTVFAAPADFNRDGWDDFVGAGEGTSFVRVYRNGSEANLPVNWDNPNDILKPSFSPVRELRPALARHRWHPIVAGDFNGDGWPDIFYGTAVPFAAPTEAVIWLNTGANDFAGNPQFSAPYTAFASGTTPATLGPQDWGGPITVADVNGDRKLDLVIGAGATCAGAGGCSRVMIFHNQCTLGPIPDPPPPPDAPLKCANAPTFKYAGDLMSSLYLGYLGLSYNRGEFAVMAYEDFDRDGRRDLVVGGPACCTSASMRLRLFPGKDGGGISTNPADVQVINFVGAATVTLAGDFSLDGQLDLVMGTDNWNYPIPGYTGNHIGGSTYYYANNGTTTPFTGGVSQMLSKHQDPHTTGALWDFDLGFVFNYDNDPDNTPDLMMADGNHSATFFVFANRVISEYVACGEVASGVIDLTPLGLANTEMVATAARLTPDHRLNGGTVTYYMSNEVPAVWVEAVSCGDGSGDLCASFDKPIGRSVQWKATLCANAYKTNTPEIRGVTIKFDYTEASVHYRTGVIVHDGIVYAGGFRQPGERGHMFAINAGLTTTPGTYWDAAVKLDSVMTDSDRRVYATSSDGRSRVDFTTANANDPTLQATLTTNGDATTTAALVSWVRSARFGVHASVKPLSKHGAIETSTAGILSRPVPPFYYSYLQGTDLQSVDAFVAAHQDRPLLALYGAKDGTIHGVYNRPAQITTDPHVGKEMWAIVPPAVAAGLLTDYTASLTGTLSAKNYPDGSPTLADVRLADGEWHSVAIVSGGNGSRSVFAMDVTSTVSLLTDGTPSVTGPVPLWSVTPGGAKAGHGYSKPVILRVKIAGAERFIAVMGTGIDDDFPDRGRILSAVDIATGAELWRFETRCALTSHIIGFETDDDAEPGGPQLDGFIDRVAFADRCGHVYKLDPGKDQSGMTSMWNNNVNMGPIAVGNGAGGPFVNGNGEPVYALFYVGPGGTTGALGQERPIVGTLGGRVDNTNRFVLFFGTGGLESHPVTLQNAFYATYADTGELRSKLLGTCVGGRCEKFYGGVLVTTEQVILHKTFDPPVGTTTCDNGSTKIVGLNVNDSAGSFAQDFSVDFGSAVVAGLYGDAGAVYAATLAGTVVRVGAPRASEAGGDTAGGYGGGSGQSDQGAGATGAGDGGGGPLAIMGWRQVL